MKSICFVLFLFTAILASATSLTFYNSDQLMHYSDTWMFNSGGNDDPFSRQYDNNHPKVVVYGDLCYARVSRPYQWGTATYYNPITQSSLVAYDSFSPLTGVALPDTSYNFVIGDFLTPERYQLCSFNHINTINANNPWNTLGAAGDCRIYSGATAYIEKNTSTIPGYYNPVTKLKLINCGFYSLAPYPYSIGPGGDIAGYGWGTIDPSEGDSAWIAELTNSTGQVEFFFNSSSAVVQYTFGLYSSNTVISPASIKRNIVHANDVTSPYQLDASAQNDVILNVQSGNYYSQNYNIPIHDCMVAKFWEAPTGTFPVNIDKTYSQAYWELGTTYNDCTASAIFDLSSVPGIDAPENIRLLRRTNGFGSIWYDTNASIISTNPLRLEVSGYNILGQYCVASTGGNNLEINTPINLRISYNQPPEEYVYLEWDPVANASYYNVYMADSPNAPESEWYLVDHLDHPICATTLEVGATKKFYFVTAEK
jgi:hypothetical protein